MWWWIACLRWGASARCVMPSLDKKDRRRDAGLRRALVDARRDAPLQRLRGRACRNGGGQTARLREHRGVALRARGIRLFVKDPGIGSEFDDPL